LEAARAHIPDAENSALVVIETKRLLPVKWATWMVNPGEGNALYESLQDMSPNQRLTPQQRDSLRAKLQEATLALAYGSKLAGMPKGRYPIKWSKDALGTLMQDQQNSRDVAELFRYDAMARADVGDLAGALTSVKAVLNSSRSLAMSQV